MEVLYSSLAIMRIHGGWKGLCGMGWDASIGGTAQLGIILWWCESGYFGFKNELEEDGLHYYWDNFNAHESAVAELEDEDLLPTVHIIWLPSRTTSKYQPMHQGVIRNWKAHSLPAVHDAAYIIHHTCRNSSKRRSSWLDYPTTYMQSGGVYLDAWKTGVKLSTLENCFEASQVKIHGPFPLPVDVDNIQELEDGILDCIRVAHPTLQLSQSELWTQPIYPATDTVEDPVSEIEVGILAAHLPNEASELEADIPLVIPSPVTPHEVLAHIEGLLLFSLKLNLQPISMSYKRSWSVSKCALRLWNFDAGSSTSRARSLTFWGLLEPLLPLPPSFLEILVPPSALICRFVLLLYLSTYFATCSTAGELDSIFPYFLCISEYIGYKHTSPRPNDMLVSSVLCITSY